MNFLSMGQIQKIINIYFKKIIKKIIFIILKNHFRYFLQVIAEKVEFFLRETPYSQVPNFLIEVL